MPYREPTFEPPLSFGEIEPAFFDDITDIATHLRQKLVDIVLNTDDEKDATLRPMIAAMSLIVARLDAITPHGVTPLRFTVDTHKVQPKRTQRGADWHIDGAIRNHERSLIGARALMTETLIGTEHPDSAKTQQSVISRNAYASPTRFINSAIRKGKLAIHRPPDGSAIIMDGQFHRSQPNPGDQSIDRSWFRLNYTENQS